MKKTEKLTKSIVYEQLQLEAMEGKLVNSFAFFERKVRRWYSKNFSTPLHDTYKIAWDEILTHYYESALDTREYNEVFEAAIEYIPELTKAREAEDEEFEKALEIEQQEGINRKIQRDAEYRKKISESAGVQGKSNNAGNGETVRAKTIKDDEQTVKKDDEKEIVEQKSQYLKSNTQPQPKEINLEFEDEDDNRE